MAHKDNTLFSSDNASPGYIESVASSKKKTKEDLRTQELIPSEILSNASGIETLLNAYYDYMNLEEFIYQQNEVYTDIVLDNKAVFRISDPRSENDHFFTDEDGANSTLTVTAADGTITTITLNDENVAITNGNNLPGSLANSLSEIGKTFTVTGLSSYNTQTATLTTPIKYWAGPGASYVLNTIEEAMDIDSAAANYLELIQKEIAAVIPRSIQVNKRSLYKSIIDYYKIRGSSDSIEVFFRLLFNDTVEIEYPYNKTLIPSSGNYDTGLGQYLDNKGFLSDDIKIHDSDFYQKFSYLIRTGQNLSSWNDVYARLVHPAGFKYFAEILLQLFATREALGDDEKESSFLENYAGGTDPSGGDFRPTGNLRYREYPSGTAETPRFTLSSMPGKQPGVIGIEDLPILVEMFGSLFLPFTFAEIHKSASIALTVSGGSVTGATITDAGFGYSSAPSITVNGVALSGQTISAATVTCTIDSEGKVDSVTISGAGSGYQSAFASVAGNPNVGQVDSISVVANENKSYSEPPAIRISAPTSKDEFGVPLSSNVTATAKYLLQPTSVSHIELLSGGNSYTTQPDISFSNPSSHYTATPFFTENFTGATISTDTWANGWRVIDTSNHTASVTTIDSSSVLQVQTTTLDTNASGSVGGAVYKLSLDKPDYTSRLAGNTIKIKCRAKKPSSGGADTFRMAYSTSQVGNSGWFTKNLTTDWQDFEFEYNISSSTPTNEDYVGFQSDGNNGIVYIDDVSITVKYDYPRAHAEIENGSISGITLSHLGSGYTELPTVSISGNATAKAQLTPSEIASVSITNAGANYILNPDITLASRAKHEDRVKHKDQTMILELNHTYDDPQFNRQTNPVQSSGSVTGRTLYNGGLLTIGELGSGNWTITQSSTSTKTMGGYEVLVKASGYRTQPGNDYYSQKTNVLNSNRLYEFNETIEVLGDTQLQSTSITDINKYNVNSFIHTN
jgi:hypothetical protein